MVIGKGCPGVHGMKAFVVVEAELHAFLILALFARRCSASRPYRFVIYKNKGWVITDLETIL